MKYSREFTGEFLGTFILILFGCGAVANSVLFDSYKGVVQVALMWGIGAMLATYTTRHLSGSHFNPALTIAMAVNKKLDRKKVPTYLIAQFAGAFLAALVVYGLFSSSIIRFEDAHGIVRGTPESVSVSKMFGEYYLATGNSNIMSMLHAMAAETLGTFILVLVIFILTEESNLGKPDNNLVPVFIGFTVSSVVCLIANFTQAGLNPARDFAPRMVAWIFGWGKAAFPDRIGGFFYVYMLAPVMGALLAGLVFTKVLIKLIQQKTN
jgi:MIP family channel proteins